MRILFGIWAVYIVRGDPEPVAELARWLREIAESNDAPVDERLMAHACIATLSFYAGDTAATQYHAERGVQLCDLQNPREQDERLIAQFGYDGLLFSHVFLAWNAQHSGEPARARALIDDFLKLAQQIDSPYCSALAAAFAGTIARDLRDPQLAREHGARAVALSVEYGYPFWLAGGLFAAGWAATELGELGEGLAQIEQGLAVYTQIGARISKPYYLSFLVEAQLAQGNLSEAQRAADEALELADQNVGKHYIPELLRLKAVIAFRGGRDAEAESFCARASTLARDHGQLWIERNIEQTLRERGGHALERAQHAPNSAR